VEIEISKIKDTKPRRKHGNIKALAESIKKEGLLQPLVVNQNNELICGRRRFEAIQLLKWNEVSIFKINTKDDIDILSKSISENLMRLNLSWQEEVKAKEGLDQLMREKHGEIKGRPKKGSESEHFWNIQETANLLNISKGLISEDLQLAEAIKQYPEIEKCKTKSLAKRKLKHIKRKERKSKLPELPNKTERYELIHGDLIEISNQIKNNSLDWIITDPPYPKEFLPLIDKLGKFSKQKLKLNGSLICMIGQSYLPEVYFKLSKYLKYNWTCAYLMPGDAITVWPKKVTTGWKPLLWFVNGNYEKDYIYDIFRSEKKEKDYHHWGQSESGMKNIIEQFTDPGELICDPFLGGGTTGVIAIKTNRLFIGIDCDIKAINITKKRLEEIIK